MLDFYGGSEKRKNNQNRVQHWFRTESKSKRSVEAENENKTSAQKAQGCGKETTAPLDPPTPLTAESMVGVEG